MIPRIVDIRAEYETPIVQENVAELQAYREILDETLAKAKAYTAENSQYLYLWQNQSRTPAAP